MRFSKASLIAASAILSYSASLAATVNYSGSSYGQDITVGVGDVALFTSAGSGAIGKLKSAGDFVLNGGGLLQYQGYGDKDVYFAKKVGTEENPGPYARNIEEIKVTTTTVVNGVTLSSDTWYRQAATPDYITSTGNNALRGSVTVNQGVLSVSGYLNQWVEYYSFFGSEASNAIVRIEGQLTDGTELGGANNQPKSNLSIQGVSRVVLNGNSEINFNNTKLNVYNGLNGSTFAGGQGTALTSRYNMVRNIMAGTDHTQKDATFHTGADASYRVMIYADNITDVAGVTTLDSNGLEQTVVVKAGNSIGKLAGLGSIYKFGPADLRILNESERGIGHFTVADGSVTLASAGGFALGTATSVNIAGTDSRRGSGISFAYNENAPHDGKAPTGKWKEAYAPNPGLGKLIIENDQTIQNLQANFAFTSGGANISRAIEAAVNATSSAHEAVIVGTGKGSSIDIGSNKLTILQARDGVYRGNVIATYDPITDKTGTIEKWGAGTLAFLGGTASQAKFVAKEGTLLLNAQTLGSNDVEVVAGAGFTLFQDNAGTLNSELKGEGTFGVTASALLNNGSESPIQLNVSDVAGTLMIGRVQDRFTGVVSVTGGVTLEFTSLANDALKEAAAITVSGISNSATAAGTVTGVTRVRIGDSVQTFKSLSMNQGTQLDLSRGVLYLRGGSIAAEIIGAGTLVKDGGADFGLDGTKATYTGATVVRHDAAGTARSNLGIYGNNALANSSGLVLSARSTAVTSGSTQVGALFGQAGSQLVLGTGTTLTVGHSATRHAQLAQELAGSRPISSNYLGTEVNFTAPDGVTTYGATDFDTGLLTGGQASARTGVAANTSRFLQQYGGFSQAEADTLDFAGVISGAGASLVKVGGDRLILSNVNTYTGSTTVTGGVLQVNYDSIAATSGVLVDVNGRLAMSVTGGAGSPFVSFSKRIEGRGSFEKIGDGNLELTGTTAGYTGGTTVTEGKLKLTLTQTMTGGIKIESGAELIANQAADTLYSGTLSGVGLFTKVGAGQLALSDLSGFAGTFSVLEGSLVAKTLPLSIDLGSAASFEYRIPVAAPVATVIVTGGAGSTFALNGDDLITAGTVEKNAVTLAMVNANTNFAGTLALRNTVATIGATGVVNNQFPSAQLALSNASLNLAGTGQTFTGLSGDAASVITFGGGTLTFADTNLTSARSTTYAGTFADGDTGTLIFNGGVNLSVTLAGSASTWQGAVTVNSGTLSATTAALGSAASTVNVTGGTFALHNANPTTPTTYAQTITGAAAATLGKTGAGEVQIADIPAGFGHVLVSEGTLTLTNGTAANVFAHDVRAKTGGVYRIDLAAAGIGGALTVNPGNFSDSDVGEHASLAVDNGTLTLGGAQSYSGNTILTNAILNMGGLTALNGLAGDATSDVQTAGALTITQSVAGTYLGTFTPATALTVAGTGALSLRGDLAAAGLASVANTGALTVDSSNTLDIANTGALTLQASGTGRYSAGITGAGAIIIAGDLGTAGADTISFGNGTTTGVTGAPYVLAQTSSVTVASGATLGGVFSLTGGNLTVASGGRLAPGNSPGTVAIGGNFTLASGADLQIELNASTSDQVAVAGTATLAGTLSVVQDVSNPASLPVGGQTYTILTATGGISGAFSNASAAGMVQLSSAEQAATGGIRRVHVTNLGTSLDITTVKSLADVTGFEQHDGIGELIALFDAGIAPAIVQTAIDSAWGPSTTALVNKFSTLGYASEYAMAQDGVSRRQVLLHDRLEQRRYDRAAELSVEDAPWEAFLVAGGTQVSNKTSRDAGTFDYSSTGGLIGLDKKIDAGTTVGLAVAYDNGQAEIHHDGGTVDMQRASVIGFVGTQLTSRWYLDAGVSAGYGAYDSKRRTDVAGTLAGDNSGIDVGAFIESGTVVALSKVLHFTPHFGLGYTHHEFAGFTESGTSSARLRLDDWSNDSLRAKVGAGLGWFTGSVKFGLDISYAHELLDTDSEISASFVEGGSSFRTTAAALPADTVSVSPSVAWSLDERTAVTLGYAYEMGMDSRVYQSVNLAYRKRF